ncbi:hypothetical protein [Streptomyces subrutilus]|uniref:hypothetical protein n=1 Tax=Streptomyces subrutilus TaxID=36818 RepID=UPI00114D23B7|nr:hypothetical protein [Streptomyces subrutilus]
MDQGEGPGRDDGPRPRHRPEQDQPPDQPYRLNRAPGRGRQGVRLRAHRQPRGDRPRHRIHHPAVRHPHQPQSRHRPRHHHRTLPHRKRRLPGPDTAFNLGKFPADFYLRNFLCEPSIIDNGGDVKLTWERSANAIYKLLYGGVNRDVTNRTSLDIEGIKSDTTFYLRATTGDPTNPVTRILSTQVTVLRPDLTVNNLTVEGEFDVRLFGPTVKGSANGGATTKEYAPDSNGVFIVTNSSSRQITVRLYRAGQSTPEQELAHAHGAKEIYYVTKGGRIWLSTMQSSQIYFDYLFLPVGTQNCSPLGEIDGHDPQ